MVTVTEKRGGERTRRFVSPPLLAKASLLLLVLAWTVWSRWHLSPSSTTSAAVNVWKDCSASSSWLRGIDQAWWQLAVRLTAATPQCNDTLGESVWDTRAQYTSVPRPELVHMDDDQLACLKRSHQSFVKGLTAISLPYKSNTRGIVTTANARYLRIYLVSLRLLRKTGCTLPVEVFLSDRQDYDAYICEALFPPLGAQCIRLDQLIPAAFQWSPSFSNDGRIHKFQYKMLSMFFSSFEDVIFLDADNVALDDPTRLFDTQRYKRDGVILWPDAWTPTTSPSFYAIQQRPMPGFFDRLSVEAGQVAWSKRRQSFAFLLVVYYTFFGPRHYFWLLAQGAMGMGDKDTFLPALTFMHPQRDPQEFVSRNAFQFAGFYERTGYWNAGGVHFWPSGDSNRSQRQHHPLFLHASWPKLDAAEIMLPRNDVSAVVFHNGTGAHHRIWQGLEQSGMRTAWGETDVERSVWRELEHVACILAKRMQIWPQDRDVQQTCESIREHVRVLSLEL